MTAALFLASLTWLSPALADENEPPAALPSTPAGPAAAPAPAPVMATHEVPKSAPTTHREFYESGWFWAAVGAAAFVGGVVFLATRDNSPSVIHLHVEVPR